MEYKLLVYPIIKIDILPKMRTIFLVETFRWKCFYYLPHWIILLASDVLQSVCVNVYLKMFADYTLQTPTYTKKNKKTKNLLDPIIKASICTRLDLLYNTFSGMYWRVIFFFGLLMLILKLNFYFLKNTHSIKHESRNTDDCIMKTQLNTNHRIQSIVK